MAILPEGSPHIALLPALAMSPGSDLIYPGPSATRWHIRFLNLRLTCSASVGVRQAYFILQRGAVYTSIIPARLDQTASQVVDYFLHAGLTEPAYTYDNWRWVPMPSSFILSPGDSLLTQTTGLFFNDQWSLVSGLADEWIEP